MTAGRKAVLVAAVAAVALCGTYVAAKVSLRVYREYVTWQGVRLNRLAWEAGFRERGLTVPEDGPRDGYWGARIGTHVVHPQLGWILPELHVPGLLELDEMGVQRVPSPGAARHLLIIGASTAFGGYASTIDATYFAQLGALLAARGHPVNISVLATGAWKSVQELQALRLHGLSLAPDVVLFLDGLNDISNGSNARTWYGVETATLDGTPWHALYHEHDYSDRVRRYLDNMAAARAVLAEHGVETIVALQPALFEKRVLSRIEQQLEAGSLAYLGPKAALLGAYEEIRVGLRTLAATTGARFIDASRAYDGEDATVFTDLWHFSDPGHRILAGVLADGIAPALEEGE